ncbi:TetR/AcrR family transcriptional regulator [Thalassobacillus sp. CUG 92003]|uniref:TetR/AcrR family transcriptional regulator n=1 Tax=Thalassobacillus sp. CUG 92003 TaxID=2736641 RepID=UPI0015E6BBC0|nr:TetR/AcrR family transcriptional regulator [Thalassobacillus sp. CUG 92003]
MTQQKILDVAIDCFGQYGYQNTSLSDIASEIGIKKPSLYNHFASKEDIFFEVLNEVTRREKDFFCNQIHFAQDATIKQRLENVYQMYIEQMATSKEGQFWKRVTFFPPEEFSDAIRQKFIEVETIVTELLRPIFQQGIQDGIIRDLDIETLTSAFYTLIDGLFLEENFYDVDLFAKRQKASWTIFWLGIKHPGHKED